MQNIRRSLTFLVLLLISFINYATDSITSVDSISNRSMKKNNAGLTQRLKCFYPLDNEASYYVSICADIPDNNNPNRVYKKKEPGHVFFILEKRRNGDAITQSFGFYPRKPASTIIFKNVRSEIHTNSNREYNASLEWKVSADEFRLILEKCEALSQKKYNLNKYNCYDYVIEVFNSLPGIEKLPITHVRFPFICGRGGSPIGLYRDFQKLVSNGSPWAPYIKFGVFRSPHNYAAAEMPTSF